MKHLLLISAVIIAATGCASNKKHEIPYGCDSEESNPFCASTSEIFANSKSNDHRTINVLVDDSVIQAGRIKNNIQSQPNKNGNTKISHRNEGFNHPLGSNTLESRPVYKPDSVHRIYRGPWTDDYYILHSGEHLFYTTPGGWMYGTMNDSGSASGLITPVSPEDLGFQQNPNQTDQTEGTRVGRHIIGNKEKVKIN